MGEDRLTDGTAIDPATGLAIPQAKVGFRGPRAHGVGTITYVCFTCGNQIVKPWEVLYVQDTEWASTLTPPVIKPGTTTHHDWHMASQQREDD